MHAAVAVNIKLIFPKSWRGNASAVCGVEVVAKRGGAEDATGTAAASRTGESGWEHRQDARAPGQTGAALCSDPGETGRTAVPGGGADTRASNKTAPDRCMAAPEVTLSVLDARGIRRLLSRTSEHEFCLSFLWEGGTHTGMGKRAARKASAGIKRH